MASFDEFTGQFHDHFTRDANERIFKGIDRDLGVLPEPSLAEADARIASAKRLLSVAESVERSELSFDDALDLDLAQLMLRADEHRLGLEFNGHRSLEQQPRAGDDIGDGIFQLMANDPRPEGDRLADITARLEGVAAYTRQMLDRLSTPVARWVAMDLEKIEGMPELFDAAVQWSGQLEWPDHARLQAAVASANTALEGYKTELGALPTTTALHLADSDARAIVALRGIDQSLEELHAMAREFLAKTRAELAQLRGRLLPRYELDPDTTGSQLHDILNQRFAMTSTEVGAILDRYASERDRILAFVREGDLFPILQEQEMKILNTPSFLVPSIPAGAMMPPPPFRDGVRTSLVYLTIRPDRLDDHNELAIPMMMVHEGIPGHHLQLATASTHPSVIRRHVNASEQAEGWTTMLEDYMLDQGLMGELTDEARFIGKHDLARIGARVAIDLFFMTGERGFLDVGTGADISADDPFEAAGSLLAEVTGFGPARVRGELNWYSQERGYPLCYLTGNRLVWQMKRDAAEGPSGLSGVALDRKFHEVFLSAGNMPLSYLRRVFEREGVLAAA